MTLFQMGKTIMKNLFSRPATLMYPKKPAKKFASTRGHVENEINRCIFCGTCQRKCPAVAICVSRDARTWEIDRFRCVACGCCVEVCPVKCLRMDSDYVQPTLEAGMKTLMKPDKPASSPAPASVPAAKPATTRSRQPKSNKQKRRQSQPKKAKRKR
jgi:formate hydrogenlyase subunit 6/NADH:ubiquinone oxidoreductase subunit I